MHSSKPLYKPLSIVTTSRGVDEEQMIVKLTMSENNTVALSNNRGGTDRPSFSSFATYLNWWESSKFEFKISKNLLIHGVTKLTNVTCDSNKLVQTSSVPKHNFLFLQSQPS